MIRQLRRGPPIWIWGVLAALVLILLSSRDVLNPGNPALQEQFAPRPAAPNATPPAGPLPQLDITRFTPDLQAMARDLQSRFGAGETVAPLQPVVETPRIRVNVEALSRNGPNVQVTGTVTNISSAAVEVPVSAFELRDGNGGAYVAESSASARLQPGESTPLDLAVPLPAGSGLLLTVQLPPDAPAEQPLLPAGAFD